jgi:transcriptional regulator with XRE-family HTH domain
MMQESLAERLRVLRAQRGMTLLEAAAKTGVGRDTLSDLERGRRHPVMPTLAKIARGYGVPVEDLLGEPLLPLGEGGPSLQEWARENNATLHGMSDQEWDDYVRNLDSADEIAQAFREILGEAKDLHAVLGADRWLRPENREQRAELARGARSVRIHRLAHLQAEAFERRAEALAEEIHDELRQEARA